MFSSAAWSHCHADGSHWAASTEANRKQRERGGGQVGETKYVSDNWHFSLLSSSVCPRPSLSLSPGPRGSPSAFSLSLIFHSPWLEPSKSTQHTETECQAAGAAVCEHSSIAHISSLQHEKPPKLQTFFLLHSLNTWIYVRNMKMQQWPATKWLLGTFSAFWWLI